MKLKLFCFAIMILMFGSCKNEPRQPYIYETNPKYTYMGIGFYDKYYEKQGLDIPNYVFSFTFLSDGMLNEDSTEIVGYGQQLYIEDFFVSDYMMKPIFDSLLKGVDLTQRQILDCLKGEYKASGKVGDENYGDSLTFAPGQHQKIDSLTYILGARVNYVEKDDFYSKQRLITDGTFVIDENGISFDLVMEDGEKLYGSYESIAEDEEKDIELKYSKTREKEVLKR